MRVGAGLIKNVSESQSPDPAGPIHGNKTKSLGEAFLFGMSFEADIFPMDNCWTFGAMLGADFNLNSGGSGFESKTMMAEDQKDSLSLKNRMEAALRVGWLLQPGQNIFLKGGAVLGQWIYKSVYGLIPVHRKKYLWGWLAGAGIDMEVSKNIIMGATVQYEQYRRQKGTYQHSGQPVFGSWSVKPSMITLSANLKYKLPFSD